MRRFKVEEAFEEEFVREAVNVHPAGQEDRLAESTPVGGEHSCRAERVWYFLPNVPAWKARKLRTVASETSEHETASLARKLRKYLQTVWY